MTDNAEEALSVIFFILGVRNYLAKNAFALSL